MKAERTFEILEQELNNAKRLLIGAIEHIEMYDDGMAEWLGEARNATSNTIHDRSCMECDESFCSSQFSGSASDVRVFLAETLPCYDRENGDDDFLYIASADDIERCAFALWRKFIANTD